MNIWNPTERRQVARLYRERNARAREASARGMPDAPELHRPRTGGVVVFNNDKRGPDVPGSLRWQWKGHTVRSRAIGRDPLSTWQGSVKRVSIARGTGSDADVHGPTIGVPERDAQVSDVRAPVSAKVREAEYRFKDTEHPGTMAMAAAAFQQNQERNQ